MRCSTVATALVAVFISYLGTPGAVKADGYIKRDLVSDQAGVAGLQDPNLVNPWGIAASQNSPFWVSDNGTGVSTLYRIDAQGVVIKVPLTVSIPGGKPTGVVFARISGAFNISAGGATAPADFIFATEDGTIVGWNPGVPPPPPPPPSTQGIIAVVDSEGGAVYKGLAIGQIGTDPFLYLANFGRGVVEVYDRTFHKVTLAGDFVDPDLPKNFAPFNVAVINGKVYVTFAIKIPTDEEVKGGGIVDVFDLNGRFEKRLADFGQLRAPWGMALAPADFGALAGKLLVGNFGTGEINAFDPGTGAFVDKVRDPKKQPIKIDGLWGLQFGNGNNGPTNTLFFTAGPNKETHGLFGSLSPNPD
jgi:uncharacterized protein (TIGR03118 family)